MVNQAQGKQELYRYPIYTKLININFIGLLIYHLVRSKRELDNIHFFQIFMLYFHLQELLSPIESLEKHLFTNETYYDYIFPNHS